MHPSEDWTADRNAEAFAVLDRDVDGKIDRLEFMIFYAQAFEASSAEGFEAGMAKFEAIAKAVRQARSAQAIQARLQGAAGRKGVADLQARNAATIAAGFAARQTRQRVSGLQREEDDRSAASAATVAAGLAGQSSRRFVSDLQKEALALQAES